MTKTHSEQEIIFLFAVESVLKDLSLRGELRAKSKVQRGQYDVAIGDKRFQSISVSEPHINSPSPLRALIVECGASAFDLEDDLKQVIESGNAVTFHPTPGPREYGRSVESFSMKVTSFYKHVVLRGHPYQLPQDKKDFFLLTSDGMMAGELKMRGATESKTLQSTFKSLPPDFAQKFATGFAKEPTGRIAICGISEQISWQLSGSDWQLELSDEARVADMLASVLKEGTLCLILVQHRGKSANTSKSCSPVEHPIAENKVSYG